MNPDYNITGVDIKRLKAFEDQRGWLAEIYRADELDEGQLPQMAYISMTRPGMSRGPHEHRCQTDLFCFLGTSDFVLLVWDNRPDSLTYRKKARIEIKREELVSVKIPPGVVHAYKNMGENEGLILNAPNKLYAGRKRREEVDEIRYENDPGSPFKIDF
jgi:dTDP-4-dehydrorhamnose 3,5-epimerase